MENFIPLFFVLIIKGLIVWGMVVSAQKRNRCTWCWGIAGVFFGLLGWLVLICGRTLPEDMRARDKAGNVLATLGGLAVVMAIVIGASDTWRDKVETVHAGVEYQEPEYTVVDLVNVMNDAKDLDYFDGMYSDMEVWYAPEEHMLVIDWTYGIDWEVDYSGRDEIDADVRDYFCSNVELFSGLDDLNVGVRYSDQYGQSMSFVYTEGDCS